MTQTYRVNGGWIYDRRYKPGDTVNLTREQYQYFSVKLPGLLSPVEGDRQTRRKTADGDEPNTNENS